MLMNNKVEPQYEFLLPEEIPMTPEREKQLARLIIICFKQEMLKNQKTLDQTPQIDEDRTATSLSN